MTSQTAETGPIMIHTENGDFSGDGREHHDRLIAALKASSAPKLLIHVHGGLVSEAAGRAAAERLDSIQGYAMLKNDGWTTAYFLWESSVREAVLNNQAELAKQPLLIRYVLKLAAWIEGAVSIEGDPEDPLAAVQRALQGAPPAEDVLRARMGQAEYDLLDVAEALADDQLLTTNLADQLRDDAALRELHEDVEAAARTGQETRHDLDAEVMARVRARVIGPSTSDHLGFTRAELAILPLIVRAGYRVLRRYRGGRDHGAYCTIVEEILRAVYLAKCGAQAWGLMKKDTADHFASGRPGDLLLAELRALAQTRPVRVLFVGHSAGAVFGAHFANQAAHAPPGLRIDCAFLAPAIRMDLAAELLVRKPGRLDHARVFTMADDREARDNLDNTGFGKVYTRSLLYLIAGVLEETASGRSYADAPLLGLQRHLIGDRGLTTLEKKARQDVLGLVSGELVFTGADGGPGRRCDTRTHGTIDQDMPTLESLIDIARRGFRPPESR